ncbi:hypothetical protein [Paenibacillus sp. Marseille-Q4541]|uniref:hypothetical protein n=1 Tax=Paenibacillus sp. Marseille-Q4541 TaxID=2831522 RepID=UPI001BA871DF|nr:hypothetical protein [Paenibacillus sp. Marseille-Q4541]
MSGKVNHVKASVKNKKSKTSSRQNNKSEESTLVSLDKLTVIAAILSLIVSGIGLFIALKQLSQPEPGEEQAEDVIVTRSSPSDV